MCVSADTHTNAHIYSNIMARFRYSRNFICIAKFLASSTGSRAASSAPAVFSASHLSFAADVLPVPSTLSAGM